MSLAKWSMGLWAGTVLAWSLACVTACSAGGDAVEIAPNEDAHYGSAGGNDSDDNGEKDSKKDKDKPKDVEPSDSLKVEVLVLFGDSLFSDSTEGLEFVYIPSMMLNRGTIKYSVSSYYIATTEVTQKLYKEVVGSLPNQDKEKDSLPVVNVSWFDAVLFCNALSKKVGLDTVYTYKSVGDENFLEDLKIDYSVEGIRLLTEMEWEVAAHGGVYESANYWGSEPASEYAYYGQSKGPAEVAQFIPNAYGLYDMAGNVAEWVNDWYDSYSTKDEENPVGPSTGTSKCVRGGGWTDKVAKIALKERDKKDPLYHGVTVGFRIAYSKGF